MLTLYADVKGLYGADRYRQAYREIKEALQGGTYAVTQKTQQEAVHCVEARLAEPQKLDQVYRRLQELLPLSGFHRQKLLERGLTEKQISDYGFCSTPVSGTEGLARRLMREGYSLKGIPGFFLNGRGNWDAAFFRKTEGSSARFMGWTKICPDFKYVWMSRITAGNTCGSAATIEIRGPAARAR